MIGQLRILHAILAGLFFANCKMVHGLGFTTLTVTLLRFRIWLTLPLIKGTRKENLAWCDVAVFRRVSWHATLVYSWGYPLSLSFFMAAFADSLCPSNVLFLAAHLNSFLTTAHFVDVG